MEERIQKSYQKYHANAFQTLLHLYQGNYWRFAMSGLFFIIKHLPSWLMPIAIANVIMQLHRKILLSCRPFISTLF